MNRTLTRIAQRRAALVASAAAQRGELAQTMPPWRARLALADRAFGIIRRVRQHPVLLLGGVTLVGALWRPGRSGRWLQRGWLAWQIARRLAKR